MRILLTGRSGQVGGQLEPLLAPLGRLDARDRGGLDLADPSAIRAVVEAVRPEVVVNAAAFTAVDLAESRPEEALLVNATAVGRLAQAAAGVDALLIHFSTDYVFDGAKAHPYVEADATNPLNVYGRSKIEGERAIVQSGCRHLIFRTSWVYGPRGRNFVRTILDAARSGRALRVVGDQRGAPTCSVDIARAIASLLERGGLRDLPVGLYHLSAAGETTWHGFAAALLEAKGVTAQVAKVRSDEYATAARRPANSLLDCTRAREALGLALPPWRAQLAAVLPSIQ